MRSKAVLTAILLAALLAPPARAADAFKEVHQVVPLDADGRLSIETFKGSIDLTTWDRSEAEISARVEPDPEGHDQARKIAQTEIRIQGSGAQVRVESDYGGVARRGLFGLLDGGTLPLVRYTIRMPRTARLFVKDYKSESRIAGLGAGLEFETYKGHVEIDAMTGPVRLETYKGEVRLDFERFAETRLETYKGTIAVGIPRSAGFELEVDLGRRGRLESEFGVTSNTGGGSDNRWKASVSGGGPGLRLETYRGAFHVRAR
jgi:hypothetical protein